MIIFSGEYSQSSKQYLLKILAKGALISTLITTIIFTAVIIALAIIYDMWILTVFIGILVLFNVAIPINILKFNQQKTYDSMLPYKVSVNANGDIFAQFNEQDVSKCKKDVKKIIDAHGCYYIVFKFPKQRNILCQKDAIIEGTIQQFESLFADKIVGK